jgi:phenylacetate-CoA ligase
VIDPVSGAVLPEGELGELVFTSLTKEALPIIRYRTRDLTRLKPGTARPAFRRMEKVTGRSDDMIILRGVNVFPTQLEELVLRTAGLAPHFQLILERAGRLDTLTVRVEARSDCPAERRDPAAHALAREVKDRVGVSVEVVVVDPDTLERSAGKLQRVIDRRS